MNKKKVTIFTVGLLLITSTLALAQTFGVFEIIENYVSMSGTGAVNVPKGTTAQRPSGTSGDFRYNSDTNGFEGYNGTSWGTVGGGGGSAGINFISDNSFEQSTLNPDSDGNGTESYQDYSSNAELYSENNTKYFRASYTSLTTNDTYVRDTFARTSLDAKDGLFSIWIKVDADDFTLCLRIDDSSFAGSCDTNYTLSIIGDDTWRKYEIPFEYGAASVEYEIRNSSYTGDVDIEVDKIYLGTLPDGYIQSLDIDTTWVSYTPTTQGFGTITGATFRWKRHNDTMLIEGTFTTGTVAASEAQIGLPNSLTIDSGIAANQYVGSFDRDGSTSSAQYTALATAGDTFINFGIRSSGLGQGLTPSNGNAMVGSTEEVSFYARVPIEGWGNSTSVVIQKGELDATKANELSAIFSCSPSTCTITSSNYDWIDSIDYNSTGNYTVNFVSGVFSVVPSCTISGNTDQTFNNTGGLSSAEATFQGKNSSGTNVDGSNMNLHCSKQGVDVNKSQDIIGNFASTKWTCETKYLSSDATNVSGSTMSDLSMSNMTIGKKYMVLGQASLLVSDGGAAYVRTIHDSTEITDTHYNASASATAIVKAPIITGCFVATATTLTFEATASSASRTVQGGLSGLTTWVQLCQLPDNYDCNESNPF